MMTLTTKEARATVYPAAQMADAMRRSKKSWPHYSFFAELVGTGEAYVIKTQGGPLQRWVWED